MIREIIPIPAYSTVGVRLRREAAEKGYSCQSEEFSDSDLEGLDDDSDSEVDTDTETDTETDENSDDEFESENESAPTQAERKSKNSLVQDASIENIHENIPKIQGTRHIVTTQVNGASKTVSNANEIDVSSSDDESMPPNLSVT